MINYYEHPALSQSRLKKYMQSNLPNLWTEMKNPPKETEAQYFGKIVDCLLTDADNFDERYLVLNPKTEKPVSEQQKKFIRLIAEENKTLVDAYKESYKTDNKKESEIVKAAEESYAKFEEFISVYLDKRVKIETEDFEKAQSMVSVWRYHPITQRLEAYSDEQQSQLALYWNCSQTSLLLKALLDRVYINHTSKTVTLVDYKTTYEVGDSFNKSSDKYWYGFQLAFYTKALVENNLIPDGYFVEFVICALQKEYPYSVTYYKFNDITGYLDMVRTVLIRIAADLNKHSFNLHSNSLPPYTQTEYEEIY